MAKKRKRTVIGTLLAVVVAGGLSFNTEVRNVFTPGPDTLNFDGVLITDGQLEGLAQHGDSMLAAFVALSTVEDPGPDPDVAALRGEIRSLHALVASLGPSIVETSDRVASLRPSIVETSERVTALSEIVQELARRVALEPLPAVFVVAGDSVAIADSARTRWVWDAWRGRPFPERETE